MHNFKKNFGQNFLRNFKFARKLVDTLDISQEDTVLEIGPGDGMVTELLLERSKKVICIEIDYDLIANLIRRFNEKSNFNIENEDILKINLFELFSKYEISGDLKVTGSLPYNISKKIIDNFLKLAAELQNKKSQVRITKMSFIVQEEVAKDYVAQTPEATFLSNYVRLYSTPKKYETISANQFFPKPKVNGAILAFQVKENINLEEILRISKVIRQGFSSPRKTLGNNLKSLVEDKDELFNKLQISQLLRPAQLTQEDWVKIATLVTETQNPIPTMPEAGKQVQYDITD